MVSQAPTLVECLFSTTLRLGLLAGEDFTSDDPLLPDARLLEAPLPLTVHLTVMVVGRGLHSFFLLPSPAQLEHLCVVTIEVSWTKQLAVKLQRERVQERLGGGCGKCVSEGEVVHCEQSVRERV